MKLSEYVSVKGGSFVGLALALPMLAFAQLATTTEPIELASTTPEVVATEVVVDPVSNEMPTTTDEVIQPVQSEVVETPAPSTDTTAEQTEPTPEPEAKPIVDDVDAAIKAVEDAQAEYFAKHGKYLQILEGQRLPEYETGDVSSLFGKNISGNIMVNVYEGPAGKGYQIVYKGTNVIKSVGYGPDAALFTYMVDTSAPDMSVASSTEAVVE